LWLVRLTPKCRLVSALPLKTPFGPRMDRPPPTSAPVVQARHVLAGIGGALDLDAGQILRRGRDDDVARGVVGQMYSAAADRCGGAGREERASHRGAAASSGFVET